MIILILVTITGFTLLFGYFFLLKGKERTLKEKLIGIAILVGVLAALYPILYVTLGFLIGGSYRALPDNRVPLLSDKQNVASLGDTLVIFTGTCKGCEFSTKYIFSDSLNIVKQVNYKEYDSDPEASGGSYNIDIEFVPVRVGKTILKMYSFKEGGADTDTTFEASFSIDIAEKK